MTGQHVHELDGEGICRCGHDGWLQHLAKPVPTGRWVRAGARPCSKTEPHEPHEWFDPALRQDCPGAKSGRVPTHDQAWCPTCSLPQRMAKGTLDGVLRRIVCDACGVSYAVTAPARAMSSDTPTSALDDTA